jgi:predicted NodU family carbamoyl transferase
MDLWTLGFTTGKQSSACLLKNSEVMFHTHEEALSGIENDSRPFLSILEAAKYTDRLDCVIHTNDEGVESPKDDIYFHFLKKLKLFESKKELSNYNAKPDKDRYLAASAFYKSGFTKAGVLVLNENSSSIWFIDDTMFYKKAEIKSSARPKLEDFIEDARKITKSINIVLAGNYDYSEYVPTSTVALDNMDHTLAASWGAAQYMYRYYTWKNK